MRSIRQILYYRLEKEVGAEKTARALRVSKGTVINTVQRFVQSGLPWPLPEDMTDSALESRLYPSSQGPKGLNPQLPSIAYLEQELAQKHVTLQVLYEEYRATTDSPVSRASFYRYYRQGRVSAPSMPMDYRGGDLVQVDYSGDGLCYTDRSTGEIVDVDLFCCCWALSSYSYAEATASQKKRDFTQSHVRAFRYFGVCSHGVVPDNLKSAVTKPHPFDPQLNPLYEEFARHYGIAVLPARIRKPKDKAKVESTVLHIQRFILARLRKRQFFSLAEINKAIAELQEEFNDRPMKDYGNQSRRERFERLDRPHAQGLPTEPFRIVDVKHGVLVAKNYHIRYDDHFYSVPFQLVGQRVTAKRNGMMVEIIHDNRTIARHLYSTKHFCHTTQGAHMPKEHQFVKGLTPGWIIAQAAKIGENAVNAVSIVMRRCEHVQQGFNAALGVLSFARAYPPERVEAACRRSLHYNSVSYRALKSILEHNLDQEPLTGVPAIRLNVKNSIVHENLRRNFGQNKSEE